MHFINAILVPKVLSNRIRIIVITLFATEFVGNNYTLCLLLSYKLKITMKKYNFLFVAVALSLALFALGCGSSRNSIAVEEGWDLLGEVKVNFVRDRDEIKVYNQSKYTAIRFKVEERDVKLNGLKVVYANGDKLEPTVDENIAAGQYSREIGLGEGGRNIRSIDFSFRTQGNILKGRAHVIVFGKRHNERLY